MLENKLVTSKESYENLWYAKWTHVKINTSSPCYSYCFVISHFQNKKLGYNTNFYINDEDIENDFVNWILKNIEGRFYYGTNRFIFEFKSDAMKFKLFWA